MTNEKEAIKQLKKLKSFHNGSYGEAINVAIKALEQTMWIPVSERLPKKSGRYWCTFGGTYFVGTDSYCTDEDAKAMYEEPERYVGWTSGNVVAWMPFPKSYKVERE